MQKEVKPCFLGSASETLLRSSGLNRKGKRRRSDGGPIFGAGEKRLSNPDSCGAMLRSLALTLTLTLTLTLILGIVLVRVDAFLVAERYDPDIAYNGGPLLSGRPTIGVVVVWYGRFSARQRAIVVDFINSLKKEEEEEEEEEGQGEEEAKARRSSNAEELGPSVRRWWETTRWYKDEEGACVAPYVEVSAQVSDRAYSLGRRLEARHVRGLARRAMKMVLPAGGSGRVRNESSPAAAVYAVFTSADVAVRDFCESKCATHASVRAAPGGVNAAPYVWAGNPGTQCPGRCAWPFAVPDFMTHTGRSRRPRSPPNGDVGMDGLVINLAAILAGAVTNPHGNAYYQGSPQVPVEAGTACAGVFGPGAFPGHPGSLLLAPDGSSYNAIGSHGRRRFLLPSLWHPELRTCFTPI